MTVKRWCDGCGELWEENFFCAVCEGESELVEVETPVAIYDGSGPETETTEEWRTSSICLNCCPGHNGKR